VASRSCRLQVSTNPDTYNYIMCVKKLSTNPDTYNYRICVNKKLLYT
jgi:hypothetical protein